MRLLALAAVAFAAAAAQAHRPARFEVQCPVCGHEFGVAQAELYDSGGGHDRDFLTHAASADGQPFLWEAWTCPKCWYTGFPRSFDLSHGPAPAPAPPPPHLQRPAQRDEPPPPERLPLGDDRAPSAVVARLQKKNPLAPPEPIDPGLPFMDYIPAWVRYDLLIQVLLMDPDTPPGLLAHACVRAAQTQRFNWRPSLLQDRSRCGALFGRVQEDLPPAGSYERDMAAAGAFEKLAGDPSNGMAARDRAFALAKAAERYKVRGEDPDAARAVALARKTGELEPGLDKALKDIEARIAREREYSLRAVPYLEKVLAGDGGEDLCCIPCARTDAEAKAFCAYLLGVIHRKAGEREKALERLEPLLKVKGLPDGFEAWIEDEIRKAKG